MASPATSAWTRATAAWSAGATTARPWPTQNGDLWFATETINQACSFQEYLADTTCGGTRSLLANWGTTIAKVTP